MKEKKNKGITLIALVITIIVLLILAGVTLSTLFGNNGILTESRLAVEANKEANAKEQVQLAWTACETEYQAAWTKDSSVEKSNYFQKENLNKNLGTGEVKSVGYVENGKSTVTYTLDGTEYEFEIASGQVYKAGEAPDVTEPTPTPSQPEETLGTLVQSVTKDNYGDYINYNVDLDDNPSTSDWRIFYNDGDNVFIIASRNVPHSKIPKIETMDTDTIDDGYVCWNEKVKENAGASAIDETVAKKFGLNWIFTGNHKNSTNTNIKCVQDLMNTSYWSAFTEGVDGAQAIGGPTIEMWIKSWNQKNPNLKLIYNDGGDTNSDGSIYDVDAKLDDGITKGFNRDFGYQFSFDDSVSIGNGYYNRFSSALSMNGWIGQTFGLSGTGGFYNDIHCWCASPSAGAQDAIGDAVICTSSFSNYPAIIFYSFNTYEVLQPVVCLPSSVNATKSGTTWIINQ